MALRSSDTFGLFFSTMLLLQGKWEVILVVPSSTIYTVYSHKLHPMELLGAGYIGVHGLQHGGIVQRGVDQLAGHELVAHIGYKVLCCQRATPIVSNSKGGGDVLALDALQQVLEADQVTAKRERGRARGSSGKINGMGEGVLTARRRCCPSP